MSVRYVVEVNDVGVQATRLGRDWWTTFQLRYAKTNRIAWVDMSIGGGIAHVACDDREHADWLRGHMVNHGGLHQKHVKVKKLTEATQ